MYYETIDLYRHFGFEKPEQARGTLTCYVPGCSPEICGDRRFPAVLILPGGAYQFTSDREAEPVALSFLAKGYASFVLRYSCDPHRFPTALREAAMAMRYIRENAQLLHVCPDEVAAIGFSAGGHLCAALGTMYDCPEVQDLGTASVLRPDILGLCYPVLVSWGNTNEATFDYLTGKDQALRARLSLEKQVRGDMPPAFIWHTRNDAGVPCRNSLLMAQAMADAGVDFALHIYRTGDHGASLANDLVYGAQGVPQFSSDVGEWLDAMTDYFRECGFRIQD